MEATCGSCIHTNSTFSGCFPKLVCVCVCARLLVSLHHDFEYAWLDVLPRRCCSKNSTVIFDFRRSEKIFLLFFLFFHRFVVAVVHDVNIEMDGWKEREIARHRRATSFDVLRDEIPPAWHNFEFYASCSDSSSRRTTCWWNRLIHGFSFRGKFVYKV